jgi:hypothetical protein
MIYAVVLCVATYCQVIQGPLASRAECLEIAHADQVQPGEPGYDPGSRTFCVEQSASQWHEVSQ